MKRRRLSWGWTAFGLGAVLLLAALAWVTHIVNTLADQRIAAETAARHEERLRVALWRLDSSMAPRLAAEAARPFFHYLPRIPVERPYERMLDALAQNDAFVPSPLAAISDDVIVLHMMMLPGGQVVSPEISDGFDSRQSDVAVKSKRPVAPIPDPRQPLLDEVCVAIADTPMVAQIKSAIACQTMLVEESNAAIGSGLEANVPVLRDSANAFAGQSERQAQFDNDYTKRAQSSANVQQWAGPEAQKLAAAAYGSPGLSVGVFAPIWLAASGSDPVGSGEPRLCYFRQVDTPTGTAIQGFLVDWSRLATTLLAEIADVFPERCHAELVRMPPFAAGAPPGNRMATVPAALVVDVEPVVASGSVERLTLALAWGAALAAIGAGGLSLRTAQRDSERRARFAGTVTHELRTPLTTFQLYTDMLAANMVPAERREEYLRTLRDESHRLGDLVENVLAYARIEEGRHRGHPERLTTADLLARVAPPLVRRAEEAGLELRLQAPNEADAERAQTVDPECVSRILFNLVDNAAKYAGGQESQDAAPQSAAHANGRAVVNLRTERRDGRLHVVVADHGPGVPEALRARLFRPFERGQDDAAQAQRGIGLGLALSRELARAMGGDLRHEPTEGGGATFRLVLG
ncbi:MAG: HAMP domain-containing histidine kinase [Phycisphaerales bacterium]|nr:HAMP domain-containing histidine kinase [Phycisphaerales bacterium]